jgi:hypothetical protein
MAAREKARIQTWGSISRHQQRAVVSAIEASGFYRRLLLSQTASGHLFFGQMQFHGGFK